MIYLLDLPVLLLQVALAIVRLLVVAMIYGDQIQSVLILGEVQTLMQAIVILLPTLGAQTLVMMPSLKVTVILVTLLAVLVQFLVQQIQHSKNLMHLDFLFKFFI